MEALETAFAAQLGCRHAVAVASGTAALHLAYLAAGVVTGDEVIVPAFTFAATVNAVLYCGGTPVFADVLGQHDLSLDVEHVAALVGPHTKAVAAVHFAGYAAPVDRLAELCDRHGLALIEDAAHAPSARLGARKLGTFGLAGAFSFFSNKVLACGEGGLLATDHDAVAAYARTFRSPARAGLNYRMDEPRAALLGSRLARIEDDIARRRALVRRYRRRLAGLNGVIVPYGEETVQSSSCYVMPVLLEEIDRQAAVRRHMREHHAIQTSLLYPAVHEFTAYRERFPGVSLPRTERAARTEVTLPLFPHMTEPEQDRVARRARGGAGGVKLTDIEIGAALGALSSGWLTMGPRVQALEAAVAEQLGVAHAIAVSSGSAALQLACVAAGVGPGATAVVSALAGSAAHAPRLAGGTAVAADIQDPLRPEADLLAAVDAGTRAIIASHPAGVPVDAMALRAARDARSGARRGRDRRARGDAAGRPSRGRRRPHRLLVSRFGPSARGRGRGPRRHR